MYAKLTLCILCLGLLLPALTHAQDDAYTCDGGPNDILTAAQAAYDAGDLTLATDLITQAATLCRTNLARFPLVSQLRTEIETVAALTCDGSDQDVVGQARTAFDAGDNARARYLLGFAEALCTDAARIQDAAALSAEISAAEAPPVLPLSVPGAYPVGRTRLTFTDPARDDRRVEVLITYPAREGERGISVEDAPPDASSAPYPLVIYSHSYQGRADQFLAYGETLSSYGFVTAAIEHRDEDGWEFHLVHRPYDVLFIIEALDSLNDGPLAGLVDGENVGLAGWSMGADTTLISGGAPVNLDDLQAWWQPCVTGGACPEVDFAKLADAVALRQRLAPPLTAERVWTPLAEPRLHGLFALAPCGASFAPDSLAEIDTPTFIIGGESDGNCPYGGAVALYGGLPPQSAHFLTYLGAGHEFPRTPLFIPVTAHYMVAFFSLTLKGQTDYDIYFSAGFANQWERVVWGVVE